MDKDIDRLEVFDALWKELHDRYEDGRLSKQDCLNTMYTIVVAIGDYYKEPWYTMYILGDLYEEALDGYITKDSFDKIFDDFILLKKPLEHSHEQISKPLRWWQKLFRKEK